MNRSQVMETIGYLTDVIGPRLTGSPQMKRANDWTRSKLETWGLTNAHVEPWGPFGRGWTLKRYSAQVVEPYTFPIAAFPKAWSPGLDQPITANVVYLKSTTAADLEKHKGKLKGAAVLTGSSRKVETRFDSIAARLNETNLLRLANAGHEQSFAGPVAPVPPSASISTPTRIATPSTSGTNTTNTSPAPRSRPSESPGRLLEFLIEEGAALLVTSGSRGDGTTIFVEAASIPQTRGTNASSSTRFSAWHTNAPATLPQLTIAPEYHSRIVRMIEQGEAVKLSVDLQVAFNDDAVMQENTIAEIPGTDLKDQIVMIGAHMDSWHSGTGATDNGAGVAAAMEAVRIIKALDLKPRRTIRVALWSGEEQGLLGSRAYVSQHFGYYTNVTNIVSRSPRAESNENPARLSSARAPQRKLVRQRHYENLSAYYNLDNGTGKIRGIYLQGNEALRPLFRRWLQPFHDLGAETISSSNTTQTDHIPFDRIGLPGFQFIQDPIDYFSRTHHSNADVYDRIQEEDMKQAATVMAAFLYNTAMANEQLPRKPLDEGSGSSRRTSGGIAVN